MLDQFGRDGMGNEVSGCAVGSKLTLYVEALQPTTTLDAILPVDCRGHRRGT